MNIILIIVGLVAGLFLWSNVIGSLFASLPLEVRLKKAGIIKKVNWLQNIAAVTLSGSVLIGMAVLSQPLRYGLLISGVLILFNLGNLKREAVDNLRQRNKESSNQ